MIITLYGSCDVRFRLQMVMHVDMLPANLWGAPFDDFMSAKRK